MLEGSSVSVVLQVAAISLHDLLLCMRYHHTAMPRSSDCTSAGHICLPNVLLSHISEGLLPLGGVQLILHEHITDQYISLAYSNKFLSF